MYFYGIIDCVIKLVFIQQIFDSCKLDDFDNQSICSLDICKMKLQYIECTEWKEKLHYKCKIINSLNPRSKLKITYKLNLSKKKGQDDTHKFLLKLHYKCKIINSLNPRSKLKITYKLNLSKKKGQDDTHKFLLTKDSVSFVQIQLKMNFISVFHVVFITNFETNLSCMVIIWE